MLIEEIVGIGEPISEATRKSIGDLAGAAVFAAGLGVSGYNAAQEAGRTWASGYTAAAPINYGPGITVELPPARSADDQADHGHDDAETPAAAPKNSDERLLALTIWGEARGHGVDGMRAVGHVIKNRAESGLERRFGSGIKGVVWRPKQFSCWNKGDPNREAMQEIAQLPRESQDRKMWNAAKKVAHQILQGDDRDPTKGSLFYHTTDVDPSWNANMTPVRRIANHVFYRGSEEVINAARRAAGRLMSRKG